MNFAGLQARIVPLVSELLATLASQNPLRMYFADIAGKTLLDIIDVLRDDGISQEAIAASLDLSMNGYRAKLKRLQEMYRGGSELSAEEPRTLLERVYAFVDDQTGRGPVGLGDVRRHFRGVKPDSLGGVLHFLVRSGLLRVSGRGEQKTYRIVHRMPVDEPGILDAKVLLYRNGPLTLSQLANRLGVLEDKAAGFLDHLHFGGELRESVDSDGESQYRVMEFHIPIDTVEGYEAAIFDHLSAVVTVLCKKVRLGRHAATMSDKLGGATFTFDVPADDPLYDEISGFLAKQRAELEVWLQRTRALEEEDLAGRDMKRLTIYVGQLVENLDLDDGEPGE